MDRSRRRRRRGSLLASLAALAPVTVAEPAVAQPSAAATPPSAVDVTTAQALFDDAKRLMKEGHYDEACPKLAESQRLDPGGGTLIALGLCHAGQGKTATAWGDFNLALSEARREGRAEREKIAEEQIALLAQKMPRVRLVVTSPPTGLEVRLDGAPVAAAAWGTALPIDPGAHRVGARAPGRVAIETEISVPSAPGTIEVSVPPLAEAPRAPLPASVPAVAPRGAPQPALSAPVASPRPAIVIAKKPAGAEDAAPGERPGQSLRSAAWIIGGIGAGALVAGGVLGLVAVSDWSDASTKCPMGRCTSASAVSEGASAGNVADASTAMFIVGGGLIGGAALMYVLSFGASPTPKPGSARRPLRVQPLLGAVNGAVIGGAF